ncbi:MAG TPA: ABC transporter ATP-binding protein [Lentisphaeria bacterium]|nr:MAG: ABC transporter ATP-binding protein [Lentisphaerae bacterium GWF2_50_93]HCE44937.1 ABC transporter ATP-binding protein [Lentisphaeria bacterium]
MIELRNVTKVFNKGRSNEFTAIEDVSLSIGARRLTVLKGPSGSGKTTALSIIGAMAKPTSGRVEVFGREITSLPERFLSRIRREHFGFIFQNFNLIKGISALENVMIPAYPCGENHGVLRNRAMGLLELFNVSGKADSMVNWLSGGEMQRVAIARALINNPQVIVADEPTAHLDTKLSREFMGIMAQLVRDGRTVMIASHDPLICDSEDIGMVVSFRDGRIEGVQENR